MSSPHSPDIRTAGEILHDVRNSLNLVSVHAQHLLNHARQGNMDGLLVIRRESDRAVALLDLLRPILDNLSRAAR
jgi:hypothetical protein